MPDLLRQAGSEPLAANSDPIILSPPRQRGYGQWVVSRMPDVRAVYCDPATTVDLLVPKALHHIMEREKLTAGAAAAVFRIVGRVHRTPNDAERRTAVAATKCLLLALPTLDFQTLLAGVVENGRTVTDVMSAVIRRLLAAWRFSGLHIEPELGQRVEDGLVDLISTIEKCGLSHLTELEPLAQRTVDSLHSLDRLPASLAETPPLYLISPAFLAIVPIALTSGMMLAQLAESLDLQEKLRSTPRLRAGYLREVERLLNAFRYPVRQIGTHGLSVGDVWLPPRSLVTLDLVAANRDPGIWADPEQCLLERPQLTTSTFGFGPLACTGAQLSRQFLKRLLDATLESVRLSLPECEQQAGRRPARWQIMRGFDRCDLQFSPL